MNRDLQHRLLFFFILVTIGWFWFRPYETTEGFYAGGSRDMSYKFNSMNPPRDKNTAYVSVIADDYLDIYLDKGSQLKIGESATKGTLVGKASCCNRLFQFAVRDFVQGDRLVFYNLNGGGPGYFAGHIYWNGTFYPSNNQNFSIKSVETKVGKGQAFVKAGKRIGCYKDTDVRQLPYEYLRTQFTDARRNTMPNEVCRDMALKRGHAYYGMQAGGYCFTGNDLTKATSLGKLPDSACSMKAVGHEGKNVQVQGGAGANDIYSTKEAPSVRMCGKANRPDLHSEAMILKSEQGPNCDHNDFWWVEYEWKPMSAPENQPFCPDPTYSEFYPVGCSDPASLSSCVQSALTGYAADQNQCKNIFNVSQNNYNNDEFFSLINQAWKIAEQTGAGASNDMNPWIIKMKDAINEAFSIACAIESNADPDVDTNRCVTQTKNKFNSNLFYQKVSNASTLCQSPGSGRVTLCTQFNSALKKTTDAARNIVARTMKPTTDLINRIRSKPVPQIPEDPMSYVSAEEVTRMNIPAVKFIKLTKLSGPTTWINLAELYAYDLDNQKIGGLTNRMSSTHPAGPAGNLVNGNENDFAHTNTGRYGDWMEVTLPKPTALSRVVIINRRAIIDRAIGIQIETMDVNRKAISQYLIPDMQNSYTFVYDEKGQVKRG